MIYLPNERSSLETLESWLKNESPFRIQNQHLNPSQSVTGFLPKFKIRSSLQLNEPLKSVRIFFSLFWHQNLFNIEVKIEMAFVIFFKNF